MYVIGAIIIVAIICDCIVVMCKIFNNKENSIEKNKNCNISIKTEDIEE